MGIKDGLYMVTFQTPLGQGTGVVYAQGGKLWGGDSTMYYTGSYSSTTDSFTGVGFKAKVDIDRHSNLPGMTSVFGREQASIDLEGTVSGDVVDATGTSPQAPSVPFSAILRRICD